MSKKQDKFPEQIESGYNIDTKALLLELSEDIGKEFGISNETAKQLTELKTLNGLEGLKDDIAKSSISNEQKEILNKFSDKKIEKLFFTISGAKEVILEATHGEIYILKEELNTNKYTPNKSWIEKRLPTNIVNRINNPTNIGDNIIGTAIGIFNSLQKTTQVLYNIGAGIIKSPIHLYLILTGKAEYKNIKRI